MDIKVCNAEHCRRYNTSLHHRNHRAHRTLRYALCHGLMSNDPCTVIRDYAIGDICHFIYVTGLLPRRRDHCSLAGSDTARQVWPNLARCRGRPWPSLAARCSALLQNRRYESGAPCRPQSRGVCTSGHRVEYE